MKNIKEKKLDEIFSLYIRKKYDWTCEVCGVRIEPPTKHIQCSHFFSRSIRPTRYDEDNADCLCSSCHRKWEDQKAAAYYDWKLKKLGKKRFEALKRKAYRTSEIRTGGLSMQEKQILLTKYST